MRAKLTRDRHEDRRIWRGNRRERYGLLLLLIRSPAKWVLVVSLGCWIFEGGAQVCFGGMGGNGGGFVLCLDTFREWCAMPAKVS